MKGMKTGGRKKGTPNKDNPLKGFIRAHSLAYFEPKEVVGKDGEKCVMSKFELDLADMAPDDRVVAEIKLLEFHTPKMKSVDVDMNAHVNAITIEDRLRILSSDSAKDYKEDEEDS